MSRCQAPALSPGCTQKAFQVSLVENTDKAWNLDFIDKTREIGHSRFKRLDGKDTDFTVIGYAVKKKKILAFPFIEVNPCVHSVVMSEGYLEARTVSGIAKNGRVFAYRVDGTLVGGPKSNFRKTGGDTALVFYDLHGTGKFDTVRTFAGGTLGTPEMIPFVPDWVR